MIVSLLLGASGVLSVASSNAQDFDELFKRPTDARFDFPAEEELADEPMGAGSNFRDQETTRSDDRHDNRVEANRRTSSPRTSSQRTMTPPTLTPRPSSSVRSPSDLKLVDRPGSISERRQSTAMQIRQARALQEARGRLARLEAARWAGAPALRPSWNPDPMTSSRYPNRRVVQVPVYVRGQ